MMTLLRVKLNAVNSSGADCTRELRTIVADRCDVRLLLALHVIRMQEVEPRIGLQPTEQRRMRSRPHFVPTEMRQHHPVAAQDLQSPDPCLKPTESALRTFLARLRQHLHAYAYAEHRHAALQNQLV